MSTIESSPSSVTSPVFISQQNRSQAAHIVRFDMNAEQHVDWREQTLVIQLIRDSVDIRRSLIAALINIVPEEQIDFVPPKKKLQHNSVDPTDILAQAAENDGEQVVAEIDWGERKRGPAFENTAASEAFKRTESLDAVGTVEFDVVKLEKKPAQ
jgi:hypothetical protein